MKRLLNRREVLSRLNCSSATLHRKIVAGEIPRPLVLGAKMRRWEESTITAYIESLATDVCPIQVAPGAKRGRKPSTVEVKHA